MELNKMPDGESIEIIISRGDNSRTFKTKIISNLDSKVEIISPFTSDMNLNIKEDEFVEIVYTTERGLVRWNCKCIENKYENSVNLLVLQSEKPGERFNRRQAYRVNYIQNIKYICKNTEQVCQGKMLDISVTGARFITKLSHEKDSTFTVIYVIKDKKFESLAKIARVGTNINDENKYGFKFVEKPSDELSKAICKIQTDEMQRTRRMR